MVRVSIIASFRLVIKLITNIFQHETEGFIRECILPHHLYSLFSKVSLSVELLQIALYEQLLSSIRDAMQSWNEEMKKASGGGATRSDSIASSAQLIAAYLDFIRLSKTIERYLLIVSHTR